MVPVLPSEVRVSVPSRLRVRTLETLPAPPTALTYWSITLPGAWAKHRAALKQAQKKATMVRPEMEAHILWWIQRSRREKVSSNFRPWWERAIPVCGNEASHWSSWLGFRTVRVFFKQAFVLVV